MEHLKATDPAVYESIRAEANRQATQLELIASENFVSRAVLEAMGTVLTNKYAEGLPGKRYYGGCEHVDAIEEKALTRAKEIFGADHANVQAHSGAQANMAAYLALLEPGDSILGMALSHGGHLTHGASVNFSGRLFEATTYGVRESDGLIDYDALRDQAKKVRPRLIIAGASAYPRILDFETFAEIAAEVEAFFVVDMAHIAGLVAAEVHPTPVPVADIVTSTTHKTLRGPRGGLILCKDKHAKAVDKSVFPGIQGGPLMHLIAAKAVAFKEAQQPDFKSYQRRIVANARALAAGLREQAFHLVSGGTDTHLVLVDLRPSHPDLTGKDAEESLERAGLTLNKNTVPGETRSPFVASGLRIGTPALTTRGMGEEEMGRIAGWIGEVLSDPADEKVIARISEEVRVLCQAHPIYADLATPG